MGALICGGSCPRCRPCVTPLWTSSDSWTFNLADPPRSSAWCLPEGAGMIVDRTSDPLMQLLVDATRRTEIGGPALARAHREVGRLLASDVARRVPLHDTPIEHPAGPSVGVRVRPGAEPIFVAMMRS